MNEVQKILRETEKDYLSYGLSHQSEALRKYAIKQIEREIERLEERKRRLEDGLDDYMLY
jgi:hypothetical protein